MARIHLGMGGNALCDHLEARLSFKNNEHKHKKSHILCDFFYILWHYLDLTSWQ